MTDESSYADSNYARLLGGFEVHSVKTIAQALAEGIDPNGLVNGRTPLIDLLEMYYRSSEFSNCVRCLIDAGARCSSPALLAVLLDDAQQVASEVRRSPKGVKETVDLRCAFTPLRGATLLHVACEYCLANAAEALIDAGADVNALADKDEYGFNGHTPIFHTVCQLFNLGQPLMKMLLGRGATLDVRLAGLTWGKGFEWETTLFDVTPFTYAQAGLLPQFQRKELHVYENLRLLLEAAGRKVPQKLNVPNEYLARG